MSQRGLSGRTRGEKAAAVITQLEKRVGPTALHTLLRQLKQEGISTREVAERVHVSVPTARGYMKMLEGAGLVTRRLKSVTDPTAFWVVTDAAFWGQDFST